jgi:hypothetical protein
VRLATRGAGRWWILGLVLGCSRSPPPAAPPVEDAGPPAGRPAGVHLPVPSGWTVVTGADGTLRVASAPGRVVLRAELRREVGLPTAETMRSGFTEGLKKLRVRRSSTTEEPGYVALNMVVGEPADASVDEAVYLSARRLGDETLLCASVRGATAAELEVAERACRRAERPDGG